MILNFKQLAILTLLVSCYFDSLAQTKINIDEGWKFHFGHAAELDESLICTKYL
jgi:hypothetical protein